MIRIAPAGSSGRPGVRWQPYLLNAPAVFILLVVIVYPMLSGLWSSFHVDKLQEPGLHGFVGLRNYVTLVRDGSFWSSLATTAVFTAGTVLLSIAGGVALAFIANFQIRGRAIIRALIVLPWTIPAVVNALMWGWIFNGEVGVFNAVLVAFHLTDSYRSWLGDPTAALVVVTIAQAWNGVPLTTIFVLAALQSIPGEILQAAEVDGAGGVRRFWHVTLPLIAQPLVVVLVFQTILSLRVFDLIYVLTGGGPAGATTVLSLSAYNKAFTSFDFGVANSYAYVIALIGLVLAGLYVALLFHRTEVEL